jgi:hypothetical protein
VIIYRATRARAMGVMGFKSIGAYSYAAIYGVTRIRVKDYIDRVRFDFIRFEVKRSFMWVSILRFDFKS